MNRSIFIFSIIGLTVLAIAWGVKSKVGDVRPAFLPSSPVVQTNKQVNGTPTTDSVTGLSVPTGFSISIFATGISGARDLQVTPEGTLLVSSITQGKVFELQDTDNNGVADIPEPIVSNLKRPHGIAFYQGKLFIAQETSVSRYTWKPGVATFEKKIMDLPAGGRHFSRSLVFDSTGKLYISIGSTCDVCNEKDERLASVLVTDADGSNPQVLASGLRNAPFLAKEPTSDQIWATEMGRDFLGDTTPPDEINIIQQGNYGWPYCYGKQLKDTQAKLEARKAVDCAQTIAPVYEIPAHSAPLGLTFISSPYFPADWQGDLLVAYHGSWNRSSPSGYSVVRLHREGNRITQSQDVVTGFLKGATAVARPVDVELDQQGALYISDDKAGNIYRFVGTATP